MRRAFAFLESTILFLSGNATHSYPISGYGLGMVLNDVGIIKDINCIKRFINLNKIHFYGEPELNRNC